MPVLRRALDHSDCPIQPGTIHNPCLDHYYVECPVGAECAYCGQGEPVTLTADEQAALDAAAMYGDEDSAALDSDPYDAEG